MTYAPGLETAEPLELIVEFARLKGAPPDAPAMVSLHVRELGMDTEPAPFVFPLGDVELAGGARPAPGDAFARLRNSGR